MPVRALTPRGMDTNVGLKLLCDIVRMQGAYGLHYYRALGAVRPVEAFIDATSGDMIAPLLNSKPLSDAEIDTAARRLGLAAPVVSTWKPRKAMKRKAPASLPPLDCDEGRDLSCSSVGGMLMQVKGYTEGSK